MMLMAATEPSRDMSKLSSSLYDGFSSKVLMHSGSAGGGAAARAFVFVSGSEERQQQTSLSLS